MRKLPCLLIAILFSFSGFAQKSVDSLRTLITAAPEDTSKVWLYKELYKIHFAANEPEKMIPPAENGIALSRKLGYPKGIDYMIFYLATALDMTGRGDEAIPLYHEGMELNRKMGKLAAVADYLINLGVAHYYKGDFDDALNFYLQAHDIFVELGEKEHLGKVLNNIGVIYRKQEKFDRAIEIYEQSFSLKKEIGDRAGMAASLQNLGIIYVKLGKVLEAVEYLENGLAMYDELDRPEDVATCHTALGDVYLQNDDIPAAKAAFKQAWAFFEHHQDGIQTPNILLGLGQLAIREQEFTVAEKYLYRGLEVSQELGQKESALNMMKELSRTLNELGRTDEAFHFMEKAYSLRDSLNTESRMASMEEMQAKFDVKQKDNELKISQLELSERTRQRNFFLFGAMALGLLGLSVFFGLRSKMKANKKLAAQNEEIQKQRIRQLEQEKKLTALSAMLEGEEKERTRIANDLHDGLGGLLASVKSHFNSLGRDVEKQPLFTKTNHLIDEAYGEVRRISHNMMPRAISLSGLPGALEDLAEHIRQKGLNCELEIIGMEGVVLPEATSINLYRIVQELTNNALKHAGAKNLLLQLIHQPDELTIIVEDDGKGFDVNEARKKKGLGLSSITSRVEFMKGKIDWDSVRGEGTTCVLVFSPQSSVPSPPL